MGYYVIIYKKWGFNRKFKTRAFNFEDAYDVYYRKHDEEIVDIYEEDR